MGCIFSCFQRNNGSTETLLFATKYCHICDTQFNNYNNYNQVLETSQKKNSSQNYYYNIKNQSIFYRFYSKNYIPKHNNNILINDNQMLNTVYSSYNNVLESYIFNNPININKFKIGKVSFSKNISLFCHDYYLITIISKICEKN